VNLISDLCFVLLNQGHTQQEGGWGAAGLQSPKWKFKKHRFCRHSDIKYFTWFTLQQQSTTKIG